MATHDYNIANQGFPAFRADLNDALAAIVSNNSNATAPATTFAHMLWVDTAANPSVLKIRNADNDAWVIIGSINQTDDKFKLTPADGVSTDTISELTSAAGVTIDGVLLKDTTVTANTIKASGTSSSQGEVQLFEDTDNGTNYVAIKAPASIAADVTWTLPNADGTANQVLKTDGSGALGWATPSAGKVLQVVSTTKTSVFTTTSTSFVDVTGLSATITPSSASSTILVMFSFFMSSNSGSGYPIARMLRDSTAIYIGDSAGNRSQALTNTGGGLFNSDAGTGFNISAQFVDSPATTSSTTYKIQLLQSGGNTARIGASGDDSDQSNRVRAASSIVLMEIAG